MNVIDAVNSHINQYQPGMVAAAAQKEAKRIKDKIKAAAENKKAVDASMTPEDAVQAQAQDPQDSKDAMRALYPNATVAEFDERIEYISSDSSKLIDHGNQLQVRSGRFQTPQQAAAVLIEASNAKGWSQVTISSSNQEIIDYAKGIGRGMGIEVKTAEEWKEVESVKQVAKEAVKEAEADKDAINEIETETSGFEDEMPVGTVSSVIEPLNSIEAKAASTQDQEQVTVRANSDELEP